MVALVAASARRSERRPRRTLAVGWGEARRGVYTYSARKKTKCGGREGAAAAEASSTPTTANSIAAAPGETLRVAACEVFTSLLGLKKQ